MYASVAIKRFFDLRLFQIDGLELQPIKVGEYDLVMHGTYPRNIESICRTGLSRMSRQHIHFVPELSEGTDAQSGVRNSAAIIIEVNINAALKGKPAI